MDTITAVSAETQQTANAPNDASFVQFLQLHQPQLLSSGVPEHLWRSLHRKLSNEVFDAGDYFMIAKVESTQNGDHEADGSPSLQVCVIREDGVDPDDEEAIFLVDHAWTYTLDTAKDMLRQSAALRQRMALLMSIPVEGSADGVVEEIYRRMWKYNQTYRLGNLQPEDSKPIWYILDEFGSKIQHSQEPSFALVPFLYIPSGMSFSLLWPLGPTEYGDRVTRDFFSGTTDPKLKALKGSILFPEVYAGVSFVIEAPAELAHPLARGDIRSGEELVAQEESLDQENRFLKKLAVKGRCKVYTDLALLKRFLTLEQVDFVDDPEEADVIWATWHFKEFEKLSKEHPDRLVNQFPNEMILTCKDLLAETVYRGCHQSWPAWFAMTFNMETQLPQLIKEFRRRDSEGMDNHWICKPWNMARSLDVVVSNNLAQLVRVTETGPKVACKYIHKPVLYDGRKFDLRILVLLKSVKPLKLYRTKIFWPRFANKQYTLEDLDDFQTHFTVMNYTPFETVQMVFEDFISGWDRQYPEMKWKDVEARMNGAIRELFEAATADIPPNGLGRLHQCRALYGIDVMFEHREDEVNPVILECNFGPDCTRACRYYPNFYDDVFNTLIFERPEDVVHGVTEL